ncbi:RNA-binding S4 domain-containing protein [Snodgrassella sp. B3882]|uniref:RNA-binding S4 domain-containing protein n=1 Tax=Snodgrassella sp. B3882 TaxID=2818037 RepID=UPI00226AF61C|nr:RNA-binding S4 domain-containing protein [Snodgrassella sp. B3882]
MNKNTINSANAMRLDKWLWCARFFKTRAMAQKHIELGRVLVNGLKVKNSKIIQIGDTIDLTLNSLPYRIKVLRFNSMRRPASEAKLLYVEDESVATKRAEIKALNQASQITAAYPDGRPTKRDRRALDKVKKHWES